MSRGVAPLLLGYQGFEPNTRIAGVILNKVGGPRHEHKLRQVVERYTDLKIVGAVQRAPALEIVERHLGLMPSNESTISASDTAARTRIPIRVFMRMIAIMVKMIREKTRMNNRYMG